MGEWAKSSKRREEIHVQKIGDADLVVHRSMAARPAAASRPTGAAVTWGAKAELLELEAAADDWLEKTLLRAVPDRLELTVVDPVVVWKVEEPLVTVETRGDVVTAEDEGSEVTPGTPLRPERVVEPVLVMVEPPLVMTVVNSLVVIAEDEPPKMVVDPMVEVMVESPLVMTVTIAEVVTAEETTVAELDPDPPAPAPPVVPPVPAAVVLVKVAVVEAAVDVTVVATPLPPAPAQNWSPKAMMVGASEPQASVAQSLIPYLKSCLPHRHERSCPDWQPKEEALPIMLVMQVTPHWGKLGGKPGLWARPMVAPKAATNIAEDFILRIAVDRKLVMMACVWILQFCSQAMGQVKDDERWWTSEVGRMWEIGGFCWWICATRETGRVEGRFQVWVKQEIEERARWKW
jgi:hypothetical protein